jgi:hypothetical protein
MAQDIQGPVNPFDVAAEIRNDIHVFSINWFVNRCPLVTRLLRLPSLGDKFDMISRFYRKRTCVLTAAVLAGDGTITVDDTSMFMAGDILEMFITGGASTERIEITAINSATVLAVLRAQEGTAAVANTAVGNTTITLIGNSRTGGEFDQLAATFKPTAITQNCQTWQHPVQVTGTLQTNQLYMLAPGQASPYEQAKQDALQNLMDDMEVTSMYGKGTARASNTTRPRQLGLKALLTTNNIVGPTNAGAYKPTDLMRDTMERCRTNGGSPDVLVVSTNFMTGLATWGHAAQRVEAGSNVFGTPIDTFECPFLGGMTLIEGPLMKPFSVFCLTSSEVRMRIKRNEFFNQRGNRGDLIEGDMIAEGAIEVENQAHHAYVEGITAFSAT